MSRYDLVYRDDIIDAVKKNIPHAIFDDYGNYTVRGMRLLDVISDVPVAQPECKKGKWVFEEYPDGYYHSECSECKHHFIEDAYLRPYNFCPNCGADMRGERDG